MENTRSSPSERLLDAAAQSTTPTLIDALLFRARGPRLFPSASYRGSRSLNHTLHKIAQPLRQREMKRVAVMQTQPRPNTLEQDHVRYWR